MGSRCGPNDSFKSKPLAARLAWLSSAVGRCSLMADSCHQGTASVPDNLWLKVAHNLWFQEHVAIRQETEATAKPGGNRPGKSAIAQCNPADK